MTKPTLALKGYVGVYEEPSHGRIEVTLEKDKLMARWGRLLFRLEHYHYDKFTTVLLEPKDLTFITERDSDEWHFRLGANGEVEGLQGLGDVFGFKGPSAAFKKLPAK